MQNINNFITIKGARVHNLKNIDIDIPRNKLVVFTGLSGSGKSSLAFDTIYAEGQRRYAESLSVYARQFLGLMNKPDVDQIDGLSPTIAIDQSTISNNPRSTVGTITEIYDYLRLLFAKIGQPHCPRCGMEISKQTTEQVTQHILQIYIGTSILILAPLIINQKGEYKHIVENVKKTKYNKIRIDKEIFTTEEVEDIVLDKDQPHNIEIVIEQLELCAGLIDPIKTQEVVEVAINLGNGLVMIEKIKDSHDKSSLKIPTTAVFSKDLFCLKCNLGLQKLETRNFSFNSPHGACGKCKGMGTNLEIDPDLIIPNKKLTIAEGAIFAYTKAIMGYKYNLELLDNFINEYGFSVNTPIQELTTKQMDILLYNNNGNHNNGTQSRAEKASNNGSALVYSGIVNELESRYLETDSDYTRQEIEKYMRVKVCPLCNGKRLKQESLGVTVVGKNIHDIVSMTIEDLINFINQILEPQSTTPKSVKTNKTNKFGNKTSDKIDSNDNQLTEQNRLIGSQIFQEINKRLILLKNVSLDYLTLNRSATTLSRGESQRIRLATQLCSSLVGVVYVLDEPSIGLHPHNNAQLINALLQLRDQGNTVLVVEHDTETIMVADYIVDIGPGAGENGGQVIAKGTPKQLMNNKSSLIGQYLSRKLTIEPSKVLHKGLGVNLVIKGASEFNLKNIDASIPLGKLVVVTGVSGSGKSTLITNILAKALSHKFYGSKELPGKHKTILGMEYLDKIITIDQSPIGRTPRSNPATYTGLFTYIRDIFSQLPEAKVRGYDPGKFSFNVVGGRCETCQGDGLVKIAMQFLSDVYIDCEECHGTRYQADSLEIYYKGKNISDILNMNVETGLQFFKHVPSITTKLEILEQVGLGYMKLGQSATSLSGGEAQRIKLGTELSRRSTGKTLYILDEPTTGLHFEDVRKLLNILNQLVEKNNSVIVIEHNLDIIKCADWILDLGPDGGNKGGQIVGAGMPRDIMKIKNSYTGQALKKYLKG